MKIYSGTKRPECNKCVINAGGFRCPAITNLTSQLEISCTKTNLMNFVRYSEWPINKKKSDTKGLQNVFDLRFNARRAN